jgi:hypothetical protein
MTRRSKPTSPVDFAACTVLIVGVPTGIGTNTRF